MTLNPLAIAAILAAAFAMIFFNYMSKSKEQSAQFKARRISKLKERARKLDTIIVGLPPAYLPNTLRELIYSSIIESLQQILALSGDASVNKQIENIRKTLSSLSEKGSADTADAALSPSLAEVKECKYLLKDLYNLVLEFHAEGLLKRNVAETHLGIVRSIMLKVSLETYKIAATSALGVNNVGLALHYCTLAKNRIDQEGEAPGLETEKAYFKNQVLSLGQRVQQEEQQSLAQAHGDESDPEVLAQWQALESSGDEWKKKRY